MITDNPKFVKLLVIAIFAIVVPLSIVGINMYEKNVKCPYCNSKFEETSDLSTHIDRIHIGPGLLEGDFRKF